VCLAATALTACTTGGGVSPEEGWSAGGSTTTGPPVVTTTTEPGPPPCLEPLREQAPARSTGPVVRQLPGSDQVATAIAVSRATFSCAGEAVVVSPQNLQVMALAARLAAARKGPLLVVSAAGVEAVASELLRLGPARVALVGSQIALETPVFSRVEVISGSPTSIATRINSLIGSVGTVILPGDDVLTVASTVAAIDAGAGLLPASPVTTTTVAGGTTSSTLASDAGSDDSAGSATAGALPVMEGDAATGLVWVVEATHPEAALVAAAAAASGGLMAMVEGPDLRAYPGIGGAVSSGGGARLVNLVGDFDGDALWQLATILDGRELPGGGYLLFPGRRMIALYGSPLTPVLGVLGEQGPEEAASRARSLAAPYGADGTPVLPAFEIIATIADIKPGADGDYSSETALDVLRPWVDAAEVQGLYVLLDLQPGLSDFLSQAKEYEELLRHPNVGLALDPEWRLEPGHTSFGGSEGVSAAEVNAVADWLALLVREDRLPQKLLLLHQFRLTMLPDRDLVGTPPELAVVIQMDGQGALGDKYATYDAVTAGAEAAGWGWGWKNFYHEDSPTPTPEQVLELDPPVVYVSYQ
jgi:hypothetical protein